MKSLDPPRFDVGALRDLAGEKVFARGAAYHRDGHVVIFSIESERVLAQVVGTEDYRTELTGRGKEIDGECSCPAFGDWGFCKHMVAAALAANAAGGDAEAENAGALSRIRDHLKDKGVDALVEVIVHIAERDPALFRRLDLAAATVHADDKTLAARLRTAIDTATRTRGYVDYREATEWADGVASALASLADLASGERAGIALELAGHAIDRIEQATEDLDDSDGHCGALMERARDIHLAAARATRPDQVALARDLLFRQTEDEHGTFDGAVELYADVLGKEGLGEYRRLAAEAWGKVSAGSGEAPGSDEFLGDPERLKDILDFFAERDGDVEARIGLRAKDLSSPWQYLQLAGFCLSQGREAEALRWAEEGLWMFEDGPPDEPLVMFVADLLGKAGREADAAAQLWRAFQKAPSLRLYAPLRKLGGTSARERALQLLENRLLVKQPARWNHPADLLIRILIDEEMFEGAWRAVAEHEASDQVKEALARASEATHPRKALNVYAERVERLAEAGGNAAYAEAATLTARMAGLRSAADHARYVAELKVRHGRKRNFMKLLA